MLKKLFITTIAAMGLVLTASAQDNQNTISAPKAGNVQLSLVLGTPNFFEWDQNLGYDYLLPADGDETIGFGNGNNSAAPLKYFNVGNDMNSNSILDLVGLRVSVFLSKHFDLNFMGAINLNITPKRDFIEGNFDDPIMTIPNQDYVMGKTNNLFHFELGSNYHFFLKNQRFDLYVGPMAGFQMARVEAMYPHTGEIIDNGDAADLYRGSFKQGQAWAVRAGIVGGLDFSITQGLVLGLEISPFMYQCSVLGMDAATVPTYSMMNHDIKILSMPRLKLGFRF